MSTRDSKPPASKTDAPLLQVQHLHMQFPVRDGLKVQKLHALTDLSFEVRRGEAVALVGESGSGKSTAARIIARLTQPTSGKILLDGEDILEERSPSLDFRARVQMIFQDPFGSLNPVHTVGYHIERPLLRHALVDGKAEAKTRTAELLERVGLTPGAEVAGRYPHELSGGMRQRAAIARALAVSPELMLADEPTSMLDASIRVGVLNLLRELKEDRGLALLFITHDLASARYLADRTLVLYAGHLCESGPSGQVMDEPAHPYTRLLLSALPDARRAGHVAAPPRGKSGAPRLINPPPGCPFAERCPDVHDRCKTESPGMHLIAPGRLVRCHLYAEGAAIRPLTVPSPVVTDAALPTTPSSSGAPRAQA
jgi:peptide/nickel transport system ATP-binding protein